MRVLLLQPNYDVHVVFPPIALGYLAACLEKNGHKVSIYDGALRNASERDFLEEVDRFVPELIGITVMSRGHNRVKSIVFALKQRFDIPIVIGGPQVSAFPDFALKDIKADFAVIGEGEITICELVSAIISHNENYDSIDGLAYVSKSAKIRVNKQRSLISDLDQIPFPAWHLMNPAEYRIVPILSSAKAFPIAPIVTTRGCPFRCTFCASNVTWHYKFRMRSPENVISEIGLLVEKFGVREIYISDDNFTLKREYTEAICDSIIQAKLNISWQCPNGVRVDYLDMKILEKMKRAGCHSVGLGIESGNENILRNVKKQLDLSVVEKVLVDLKKVGIMSYGFFIFGLPGETHQTIRETIDFAKNNSFDRVWFNIFTPYPGSEIFNEWVQGRSLGDIDWDSHDGSTAVMDIVGLSPKELERYQMKAVKEFYLRPQVLLDLIIHIRFKQIVTIMMTRFFKKRFNIIFRMVHSLVRRKKGRCKKIDREIEDYSNEVRKREKIVVRNKFHQANRRIIAEMVKRINNGYGEILEIGCGHGDVTRGYIAPNCASVIATDVTKRFIGEEISRNIKFQLVTALNLSFPDNTFDGVISVDVIEHVEDDVRFIEEGLRVTKKGGTLFFTTPNRLRLTSLMRYLIGKPIKFPHSYASDTVLGDIRHLREYSYDDIKRLVKKFPVQSYEIKGVWLGVPSWQIGIIHPPKFLEKWAFSWHVKIIK